LKFIQERQLIQVVKGASQVKGVEREIISRMIALEVVPHMLEMEVLHKVPTKQKHRLAQLQ
jgi:hypothetical protein